MKVSLNSIRKANEIYGSAGDPAPDGISELVEKIGAQLGAVEEVNPVADKYEDALVVRVVACEDHPQADRLHVCKIDDGGKAQHVERDENGHVQVVCGAPNVHADMLAVWLPPGATVPSTFYDIDTFKLGSRELRGVMSNGMLASPKELALGDNHEGILEVDSQDIAPGTSFIDAFSLHDDHVIDIENKMFTHRPDCFGQIGIARELEGIQHRPYKSPEWYQLNPEIPNVEAEELKLEVRNEVPELVPRFTAITMRDVTVKPSPVWLQITLSRVGIRPVNNIVDYSNFFMIATGQPIHIYDYDKVKAQDEGADHATIVVRQPRRGEKLQLLNGKEIEPRKDAIMIGANDRLIGVGGVMGGTETEVDEHTKNIIIEVANFDMYSIRRTSMAHGLFTDAVTRFNKGQSPLQTLAVVAKTVDEIRRFADGKVASPLIDVQSQETRDKSQEGSVHPPVEVSMQFINKRLGLKLPVEEMKRLLENVEFQVETLDSELMTHDSDARLRITAPFWRTDIEIAEDVVEEVGRLHGFDRLPLELPKRTITPAPKDELLEAKQTARTRLARLGANEVLTYSFVHGDLLRKVGQNPEQAFKLSNALSPDLQYYRLSLTPSLLDKVHMNIKAGYGEFALFEIGKAHILGEMDGDVPHEFERLALVYAADEKHAADHTGAAFYHAKAYLMHLLSILGLADEIRFESLEPEEYDDTTKTKIPAYEPSRSAVVLLGDKVLGEVGEYTASVRRELKLPVHTAGFELDLRLLNAQKKGRQYTSLPRFPKVEQDMTLRVPADMAFGALYEFVDAKLREKQPENALVQLSAKDIYQPDDAHKNITLRLTIASYEQTLTDKEVASLLDAVAHEAQAELGAERV